ncbi:hypothetical protein [Amnibacterium kyonggiense]|uniref:Uncharacterized protein n=1 Tax=Amnibacterium kyonggiense TaxID=595671 RepID=A0A4R7FIP6_9MICO|nr:hypothetical protein [Amnibacterium kyonggiense]TDS74878.1 hypothetical protein CLV52_3400 [Amnibacterium kyonggiense]
MYLVQSVPPGVVERLGGVVAEIARRERITLRRTGAKSLVALPTGAPDVELIETARAGRAPLRIAVSGDRIAVHLPHELADGVEGTRLVAALLSGAAGEPPSVPEPGLRMPLVRALRAGGRPALRSYLLGRAERRALPDPGAPVARTEGAFDRVTLDALGVAQLRRARSSGGRATVMSRAASVALAALGAVTAESTDARVVLPSDLRALVGGHRVAGNFVSAEAYGTLRGTDWSPAGINRMLAARRATGAVALAAAIARRVLRPARDGGTGHPTISVSLMGTIELTGLSVEHAPVLACATVGGAAGTFVFVAQVRDALTVSLWDDTGLFDVGAFPAAFRAEMERRTA